MSEVRDKQGTTSGESQDLWEFLYLTTPDLEQLLNQMLQLSLAETLQLCIVGPRGSGKSSLRRRYLKQASPEWHICDIRAHRGQTPGELLRALAANADLPTDCGEVAMLHLLAEYTTDLSRTGRIPILVIDDAHLLPVSTLQLILQLSTESDNNPAPWKLLIFTEQSLEERLAEASKDNATLMHGLLSMNMPALSHDQAMQLFERLQQASGGAFDLDHETLDDLLSEPRYPGRIIEAITAHAGIETVPEPPVTKPGRRWHIDGRWLAGGAVAVLLVLALVFQQRINALFQGHPSRPDYTPPEPVQVGSMMPANPGSPAASVSRPASGKPAGADEKMKSAGPARISATPASSTPHTPAPPLKKPAVIAPTATPAVKKGKTATVKPSTDSVTRPSPGDQPVKATAAHTKSSQARKRPATAGKKSSPPADPDLTWIRSQPAKAYTLQLMASSHRQTVTEMRKRLKLPGLHVYRWRQKGKALYMLIHGQYPNLPAARAAVRKLPADVRRNRPWPVRFSVIQQRIGEGGKR